MSIAQEDLAARIRAWKEESESQHAGDQQVSEAHLTKLKKCMNLLQQASDDNTSLEDDNRCERDSASRRGVPHVGGVVAVLIYMCPQND
jgi:hypothetical protein